jgi:hypothetical protein
MTITYFLASLLVWKTSISMCPQLPDIFHSQKTLIFFSVLARVSVAVIKKKKKKKQPVEERAYRVLRLTAAHHEEKLRPHHGGRS